MLSLPVFFVHDVGVGRYVVCLVILTSVLILEFSAVPSFPLQFMLIENATLLLAASDFLSEASWDSVTLPTTVLCSFVLSESLSLSVLPLFRSRFVSDVLMFSAYK